MASFALHVAEPTSVTHGENVIEFYWSSPSSSFITNLGPSLGKLGAVPARNADAVRLAVGVYAADRSVLRQFGGSNWNSRQMALQVPVSDAAAWTAVAPSFESLLGFLTGDVWTLSFVEEDVAPEAVVTHNTPFKRVVLLSGGADSVVGALQTRLDTRDPDASYAVVSHYSQNVISAVQRTIAGGLVTAVPEAAEQRHFQVHLARKGKALDGSAYRTEPSSRSRSFMFITFGLALASIDGVQLWIPENGFASLNPPLGMDRLGSLSTKTTHPAFLSGLSDVLTRVGAHANLHNPYSNATKGEMFSNVKSLIGVDQASKLLSATNSCAHTGHAGPRPSSGLACGVCFGCVMRRASFRAANVPDASAYADPSRSAQMKTWIDKKSILQPARNFVRRGVRSTDLVAMSLPDTYELQAAFDLCGRGVGELKDYLES